MKGCVTTVGTLAISHPQVFRGLLGFSTWWCCFAWFASAAIGIGYQSYFADPQAV